MQQTTICAKHSFVTCRSRINCSDALVVDIGCEIGRRRCQPAALRTISFILPCMRSEGHRNWDIIVWQCNSLGRMSRMVTSQALTYRENIQATVSSRGCSFGGETASHRASQAWKQHLPCLVGRESKDRPEVVRLSTGPFGMRNWLLGWKHPLPSRDQ